MVAYSFQKRFVAPIKAEEKLQTVRAQGKRRHARPGEDLQLYTGMRTRSCELIGRRRCRSVHPIIIGLSQERIFLGADCPLGIAWQPVRSLEWTDGRPVPMRETDIESFAKADGFRDWQDMREFWRAEHGDVFDFGRLWHGLLIRWLPYDLVSIDAIANGGLHEELRAAGLL